MKSKLNDLEDTLKNYNLPLQQSVKRASSQQKQINPPTQVLSLSAKSPEKVITTANRLFQKRKSVEKKLEEMRKQKIEAELKEVQNKPTISTRSRKLAEKAELKIFHSVRPKEIKKESKTLCEDEMIELEHDIQMLEACLNIKDSKFSTNKFEEQKNSIFASVSDVRSESQTIVARVKQMGKRGNSPLGKSGKIIKDVKKVEERTQKGPVEASKRKFIKSKSPRVNKCRSVSIETLGGTQFCYRSLSPFQITLKRTIENVN